MTTKNQAIAHLMGPAMQAAAEAVRTIQPFSIREDSFHIAPGTALHSVLHRELNLITLSGAAAHIPLQPPATPGVSRFDAAVRSAARVALRTILISLSTLLDTHPDDPPHPVYQDPDVQEAARKAVNAVLPTYLESSRETPGQAGYRRLRDFLGHHTLSSTLKVFGAHAALKHAAFYTHCPTPLLQAAATQPNATLFLGARSYLTNRQNPTFDSPQQVLDQAKSLFRQDIHYRPRPTKGAHRPNEDDTTDLLWPIFLALPHNVLRHARLDWVGPAIIDLCESIAASKLMPRPHILHTLLHNPQFLRNSPKPLIRAFIHHGPESDVPLQHDTAAQQFADLHALAQAGTTQTRRGRLPNHTITVLRSQAQTDHIPWDTLLRAASEDAAHPTTKVRRRPKTPNSMQLEHTLQQPAADDVILMATETPTWGHGPTPSAKLFGPDPEKPFLEIIKHPDHTLDVRSTHPLTKLASLPSNPHIRPGQRTGHQNNPESLFHHRITESLIASALDHLREHWTTIRIHPSHGRPTPQQTANAIRSALFSTHKQYKLTQEIDAAIADMSLHHVRAKAHQYADHITTFHYNTVLNLGHDLTKLARTNPGAVAWTMNHVTDPTQLSKTIRHPGQIITLAKKTLQDAGLHPRNWKFVTALNHPIIKDTHPYCTGP